MGRISAGDPLGAATGRVRRRRVVLIGALLGSAFTAAWIVWNAPAFLAELLVDAALAAGLYRRLRNPEGSHWLATAVRRTWKPFLGIALIFTVAGALLQTYDPDARTVGDALRHRKATDPKR